MNHGGFYRRFKQACREADAPENKTRLYNLRHICLTEVARLMGYEQLSRFAGWKPGSDCAKVYVHLNSDDVNRAIRDKYGLESSDEEEKSVRYSYCGTENQPDHSECGTCGRILSLEQQTKKEEKQQVIERLAEFDKKGILEKLEGLEER